MAGEVFGVIGAGTMGNGIAQVAARAGFAIVMRDLSKDFLQRGLAAIDKSLQRDVDKERLTADEKQAVLVNWWALGRIDTLMLSTP